MLSQALSWPHPPVPRVGQWDSSRPHLLMVQLQETTDPAVSGWAWLELRAQVDSTVWAVWKGLSRQGGGGGGLCGGEGW